MLQRMRTALTRDGTVGCTVGNWLTARGWLRTYFAFLRIEGVYRRRRHWLERWTTQQAPPCPRSDEVPDVFRTPRGGTRWQGDGTCSYCGSLSPDQLFAAIEAGATLGPTDKNYKVYVEGEGAPKVHGACKFYFRHFNEAQCRRFLDLFNAKKIKVGYPGHFYVLPYFMRNVPEPNDATP